jgi:glycosyltransferase involved in cell wall biosynthesis
LLHVSPQGGEATPPDSAAAQPSVLVVHPEARHNYALPAAFAEAGMLEAFYTDACAGRGLGKLAERIALLPLPGSLRRLSERLTHRQVPAGVLARTRTADFAMLAQRITVALARSEETRFRAQFAAEERYGRAMRRWGLGGATHLFNIMGGGRDLNRIARGEGLPVLSDVIIALSTPAIVEREYRDFPGWGRRPPDREAAMGPGFRPEACFWETTDIFVCPSAFVADDLVANWSVPREATRIVPYAVRENWFDVDSRPMPGRVLFVGSAERRKGIHYLAMAAEELRRRDPSIEIRVAGGVSGEVRDQPICRALTFLGRVPRHAVMSEFAAADVFVLPTLAEGSATVIYEAMAAGVPVVTTKSAGSMVRDGVDGLIVAERDPEALAEAIGRLVGDRPLRDAMASSARARASEFRWESYAEKLTRLVRETPSARARPAPTPKSRL